MLTRSKIVRRIKARIDEGEDPYSSGDRTVGELRQILCEHKVWRIYDGPSDSWVDAPRDPENTAGCHCKACGISAKEAIRIDGK